ncbi:DDB1- and CUL4-associated factor 5-like [Uloborus diversus]|uniref:DDB1- and CUL4-associated factor 5-like n=1 Tax=Uloborus diversus TaxID=327109 RepID=UPI0024092D11|nr:DDB1- and CUL4-associated factor 5-like [Uloborus diversus]
MSLNVNKSAFMTGIHYLNHQQYCGERSGGLRMIDNRLQFSKHLYSKNLYAHYGCVNAIEFSNDGEWLVSGGDDKRVLIWNVDKILSGKSNPKVMKGEHNSNIFCLGFNTFHTKLFSAGNDEQVILHDVNTAEILDVFLHDEAVYGLSVHPANENIFASACDDGRILIWDIRQTANDALMLAGCSTAYHAVMYNPVEPRFVATANAKDGVCLWDIRKPRVCLMKYISNQPSDSAMSVRFNNSGTHLLALRRRLPPVLYDITADYFVAEFDHEEYYNSCTMKSCCFAGDKDQYVLSGSDDFRLYVWKIPDSLNSKSSTRVGEVHRILTGHRSIVNQVRYNNTYGVLASSGVEKIVKLWSSFSMKHSDDVDDYLSDQELLRKVYSHEEYINLVLESGQFMTHDYSHHSVQEDQRMMAFFDSLVQRDIEGWTSDSNDTDLLNACIDIRSPSSSSSSSSSDDDSEQQRKKVKQNENNITPAPQSDVLNPTTITLTFITQKAMAKGHTKKSQKIMDDKVVPGVNRISWLIAHKRREQKLRTSRGKCNGKNSKVAKHHQRDSVKIDKKNQDNTASGSNFKSCDSNCGNSSKDLSTIFKAKDKRKLYLKRRAKISKDSMLDEDSSDSDENSKELTDTSHLDKTEHKTEESEELPAQKENGVVDVSSTVCKETSNFNSNESLPNSSGSDLNGTDSSVAANSSSLIYFSSKNMKHSKRNYRKKSADELEED